jgi:hypothetical protein
VHQPYLVGVLDVVVAVAHLGDERHTPLQVPGGGKEDVRLEAGPGIINVRLLAYSSPV